MREFSLLLKCSEVSSDKTGGCSQLSQGCKQSCLHALQLEMLLCSIILGLPQPKHHPRATEELKASKEEEGCSGQKRQRDGESNTGL